MRNWYALSVLAVFLFISTCRAATVTFSDLNRDGRTLASEGIHVTPTGPDNLAIGVGSSETLGLTAGFIQNTVTSRYYSGIATFDQPATQITFDVARANDSRYQNQFTLVGYSAGRPVASTTVSLRPTGDWTHITINAPSIDRINWQGQNWIIQPAYIRDFHATLIDPAVISVGSVGAGVPEPATTGFLFAVSAAGLLRRARQSLQIR